jgi:hypothetical protein
MRGAHRDLVQAEISLLSGSLNQIPIEQNVDLDQAVPYAFPRDVV